MMRHRCLISMMLAVLALAVVLTSCEGPKANEQEEGEQPPQEPDYRVGPFYQEVPTSYGPEDGLPADVRDVAGFAGEIFFATADGTYSFDGDGFSRIDERASSKLFSGSDVLWIAADAGAVLAYDGDSFDTYSIQDSPQILSLWEDSNGRVWIATDGGVFVIEGGKLSDAGAGDRRFVGVAEAHGKIYAAMLTKVMRLAEKGDWEELDIEPLGLISTLFGTEDKLWIGTDGGINVLDESGELEEITGEDGGLPYLDVTSIHVDPDSKIGEVVWVGTTWGACRKAPYNERWNYYTGMRFVPSGEEARSHIRAVFPETQRRIWIVAEEGVCRLDFKKFTLEEKAELLQEATMARHDRDPGLVCDCRLTEPGNLDSAEFEDCDNDGLWTAIYVGGLAFKYAVTSDPETKDLVEHHIAAIVTLERVTVEELTTDEPTYISGLIARSVVPLGEKSNEPSCYPYCQWRPNSQMGYDWKSDVSSDEATGHFFIYGVYWDLFCGDDEDEWAGEHCADVRDVVEKMMDHIIDNDFYFIDWDGQHTTWGVWNPDLLTDPLSTSDPIREDYIGLIYSNAVEILSFLRTAKHITNDEERKQKYEDALRYLIDEYNYDYYAERGFVYLAGAITNHSTDELLFLNLYNLLRYEPDPLLLQKWANCIRRGWIYNRLEQSPLWSFIYGAVTPNVVDFGWEDAIFNLVNQPIDLIDWTVRNSQRADIKWAPLPDRFKEPQTDITDYPLPPDERSVERWNHNPFKPDGGCGGREEKDAGHYLLPYWMGRYHGFIVEDDSLDVVWP